MMLVDCPHCSTRVLPMTGRICPACQRNVDADREPAPRIEAVNVVAGDAADQLRQGVDSWRIETQLIEQGMDPEVAALIVSRAERHRVLEASAVARQNRIVGALWCVGGIGLTALTWHGAVTNGGPLVFAWGAILFGGIQFLRGVFPSATAPPP